jgi:hypothetical protein
MIFTLSLFAALLALGFGLAFAMALGFSAIASAIFKTGGPAPLWDALAYGVIMAAPPPLILRRPLIWLLPYAGRHSYGGTFAATLDGIRASGWSVPPEVQK